MIHDHYPHMFAASIAILSDQFPKKATMKSDFQSPWSPHSITIFHRWLWHSTSISWDFIGISHIFHPPFPKLDLSGSSQVSQRRRVRRAADLGRSPWGPQGLWRQRRGPSPAAGVLEDQERCAAPKGEAPKRSMEIEGIQDVIGYDINVDFDLFPGFLLLKVLGDCYIYVYIYNFM